MRKFLLLTGIIVVLLVALMMLNPWAPPSLDRVEARIAVNADASSVYLIENREELSYILEVDEDGKIGAVYSEPAWSTRTRSAITELIYWNNCLWFIRESGEAGAALLRDWELVCYDPLAETAQTVYARVNDSLGSTVRLSADSALLYLTVCAYDGKSAEVFELDPFAERTELRSHMTAAAPEGLLIQAAQYGGRRLRCVMSDGRLLSFAGGAGGFSAELAGGVAQALSWAGGEVFFFDAQTRTAYYSVEGATFETGLTDWMGVRIGVPAASNGFIALVSDRAGHQALVRYDGTALGLPVVLSTAPGLNMRLGMEYARYPIGWMVLAGVLALLLVSTAVCVKKFIWRLTTALYSFAIVLTLILVGTVYQSALDGNRLQRQQETRVLAEERLKALGPLEDREAVRGRAADVLQDQLIGVSRHVLVSADLLYPDMEGVYVAASRRLPYSLPGGSFDAEVLAGIERALADKKEVAVTRLAGGQYASISLTPLLSDTEFVGLLLTRVSVEDVNASMRTLLETLLLRGGIAVLASFMMIFLITMLSVRTLRLLPRQMNEIAAGRLAVGDIPMKAGEVGEIQHAMQELCVSLSIKEYEAIARLKACHRFVPQALEKLLGRTDIMEIVAEDSAALSGEMGIVTTQSAGAARVESDNTLFTNVVSAAVEQIHAAAKDNGALFMSSDFSLADFRLLFSESAADGVRFGLQLMGHEAMGQDVSLGFSLILHSTSFIYGIAGLEDRAVSFLSSYEMGLLRKLAPKFSDLGVKILVTEQYLQKLDGKFSARYVGFVTSPDESCTIKLYEVLDVFPPGEKLQREQYDYQFQEAIRLYYKNDFYPARNIFSSLYKICPKDCMARWYILACEQFFNSEDISSLNYGIFGMDGLED